MILRCRYDVICEYCGYRMFSALMPDQEIEDVIGNTYSCGRCKKENIINKPLMHDTRRFADN